ncbi:MAG: mannose-6-phosphate isomerase, class I [Actinomycetales bacterium]
MTCSRRAPTLVPGHRPTRSEATIYALTYVLRDYAWGSTTSIPQLLGLTPTGEPVAELWLGSHPDSPASIRAGAAQEPLDAWLGEHPEALGQDCRTRFGDTLPYLLKVLAAQTALSLQVHPTREQASQGYAAEEDAGVPRSARHRRYKDPNHKPEMVVALTEFDALCGIRPVAETVVLLRALAVDHPLARRLLATLDPTDEAGSLRAAFELLLSSDEAPEAVSAAEKAATGYLDTHPDGAYGDIASTVLTLAESYPGDAGVLVALLLNRLTLAPGEALYLPAGNVHAYLRGTAVEVMATSDNVLRAGLTPKYVDVAELMSVVDFSTGPVPYVVSTGDATVRVYRPGAAEFELAWVRLDGGAGELAGVLPGGPRIVLCLAGQLRARTGEGSLELAAGGAALVTAQEDGLTLTGAGLAVVVAVPAAD